MTIDRLNNLRFIQEENRLQNLNLDKFKNPINNPNFEGIIKGNIINTLFYSTSSQIHPRNPNSPTNSKIRYFPPPPYDPQINVITKQFELNKERLRKEFMSPQYEEKRKWFFKTYSKFMGNHIREKYYDFMNEIQAKVKFFDWFDRTYTTKNLRTIKRATKNWIKEENNEVIHEEFPPHESILVTHRNLQITSSPIKYVSLGDDTKNFKKIIEQNNYSNIYLKIIREKLDKIEN